MGATYLDEKGNEIPIIMGCYGIGINRIVAAAVEAGHDANGIIWPLPLAPYQVVARAAPGPERGGDGAGRERSSRQLEAAGLDVLIDDRDQRPGVKFKDADLIGIPLRVVIGERGLKEGTIEVKWRHEPAAQHVAAATAAEAILAELAAAQGQARATAASGSPGPGRSARGVMKPADPLPRLPYVLLGRA